MRPEVIIPLCFFVFVLFAWTISTYNKFIRYRNKIEEAWSAIDVALKRRANLIPNLIRVIEGYSNHEAKVFQKKTEQLAGNAKTAERMAEESHISKSLGGLMALAEAYPNLKASGNFLDLQNSLDEIEQEVQRARDRYNSDIGRLNTLVESFPSSIIARRFGFSKKSYLALELATQREMPEVDFSPAPQQDKKIKEPSF
ncbi:MAG: LemA family protein [Proteobacteria bacterium]|nr:LemA family protein [Pseudomonadota bacterium]MBU4295577.1 LemA family protein [Pseudomonadota bacterium]MCG2747696.1 LemA family protein [Desulfobulbaceae bacterium]